MPNETKIFKLSLKKLESFKSKLGKAQAKRISLGRNFIGKASFELNDNLFIVDDFKASVNFPESFNDSVITEDNIRVGIKINFTDGISVEDVATIPSILNKVLLSDSVTTSDSMSAKLTNFISFLDSLTPEDIVNYKDRIPLSDSVIIDETFLNTLLNSVNLDDEVNVLQTFSNALNNSIDLQTEPDIASVSDELNATVDMIEQPGDSVSVDESFNVKVTIPITLSDSTTVSDAINVRSDLVDSFNDSTTVEDAITDKLDAKVVLNDTVSATDEFSSIANFVTSFIGTITTNEEFNFGVTIPVDIPEPINTFNVETDTYNSSISYFIYGVFVSDELVAIVIRNPLVIKPITPLSLSQNLGNLTFQWQADEFSNQYELQVATSSNFSTGIVINQTAITGTSYTPQSTLSNNTYYWRIRGKNTTNGKLGSWTSIRFTVINPQTYSNTFAETITISESFTTQQNGPTPVTVAPTLISPTNAQQFVLNSIIFDWNSVPNASNYDIQVSTNTGFTALLINVNTANSEYPVSGLANNTTYYWRVRGRNSSATGPWSTVFNFKTINPQVYTNTFTETIAVTETVTNKAVMTTSFTESISTSDTIFGSEDLEQSGPDYVALDWDTTEGIWE